MILTHLFQVALDILVILVFIQLFVALTLYLVETVRRYLREAKDDRKRLQ